MNQQRVPATLEELVLDRGVSAGDLWITVKPENIRAALAQLKRQGFECLSFLTCVDHLASVHGGAPSTASITPDDGTAPVARFELVYQLRSIQHRRLLRVRTFLSGEFPTAPTVSDIYSPANWDERETYDMFGIRFDGHPDLTRILMPDDWVGYPLRRDYPMGGEPVDFSEENETWHTAPPQA